MDIINIAKECGFDQYRDVFIYQIRYGNGPSSYIREFSFTNKGNDEQTIIDACRKRCDFNEGSKSLSAGKYFDTSKDLLQYRRDLLTMDENINRFFYEVLSRWFYEHKMSEEWGTGPQLYFFQQLLETIGWKAIGASHMSISPNPPETCGHTQFSFSINDGTLISDFTRHCFLFINSKKDEWVSQMIKRTGEHFPKEEYVREYADSIENGFRKILKIINPDAWKRLPASKTWAIFVSETCESDLWRAKTGPLDIKKLLDKECREYGFFVKSSQSAVSDEYSFNKKFPWRMSQFSVSVSIPWDITDKEKLEQLASKLSDHDFLYIVDAYASADTEMKDELEFQFDEISKYLRRKAQEL